ncbi:MAG: hypothetical protein IPM38_00345 [Ignavibacteria bacterium]|nr:hypothetical protein [Ignavibacteria bacterium]
MLLVYTYNTHSGINMYDVVDSKHGNRERVQYCQPNPSNPVSNSGWVVKDLIANREQINLGWNYEQRDSPHDWYVMPRIRIDSSFAADPANFNKPICKIIILDFKEDTLRTVILRVNNFKLDPDSIYHGNYLEEYFDLDQDSNLVVSPGWIFNPDSATVNNISCKVDFRVWYYGECEMWIDRVRVENEVAHRLLSGNDLEYENWLRWECNLAMENPDYIRNFYIEEFEFNAIPCIKYVNHYIDSVTTHNFSLMVNLNYDLFRVHTPQLWEYYPTALQVNKFLIQEADLKTWLNVSYALEEAKHSQ